MSKLKPYNSRGGAPIVPIFKEYRFELTDLALHNFVGLSCFFHKPGKCWDKIRANTVLCENIGLDVKVLVLDVKVLVPDVKVLVPGR